MSLMKDQENNKPEKKAGKVIYRILLVVLIIIILAAAGLLVPRLFGVREYAVVSGSMEPSIHVGSLVFVTETDPSTLEDGEVIAYSSNGSSGVPVVHRVILNDRSEREVHTKGDANPTEDIFPVGYDQVIGKVVLAIPVIGRIFMR